MEKEKEEGEEELSGRRRAGRSPRDVMYWLERRRDTHRLVEHQELHLRPPGTHERARDRYPLPLRGGRGGAVSGQQSVFNA